MSASSSIFKDILSSKPDQELSVPTSQESVEPITARAMNIIKLDGFEEYQVTRETADNRINFNDLPTIDIQPKCKDPKIDNIPDDPIFSKEYLLHHNAIFEQTGYFARGDNRSPDSMGGKIVPKCSSPQTEPHYNIQKHRQFSDCSGFVSLTDKMKVAHVFGQNYESVQSGYYVYIVEMDRGIWMVDPPFPSESEHTAIGSVPIISYRKCASVDRSHTECSSIFIKKDIPDELKDKLIKAQLLPFEKIKSPVIENHNTKSLVLEIYQDLMHIRNHALLHPYEKEVPKLLRLPVISILVAMSANQHSKHPVRDSLSDMTAESSVLIGLGLALGETPAALALMASHLAESGLDRFPSWEEIGKMPRTTTEQLLAHARMIEVRATAEFIAKPSKATKIISQYIKSWMDDFFSKKHSDEELSQAKMKLLLGKKQDALSLFPSEPLLPSLVEAKPLTFPILTGLSDIAGPRIASEVIGSQVNDFPSKSNNPQIASLSNLKLNSLSDSNKPHTSWDKIRLRIANEKLSQPVFKGLSLGSEPKTGWDVLKSKSDAFAPPNRLTELSMWQPKSFGGENLSHFQKPESNSSFGKGSPSNFFESKAMGKRLAYQPFPNAWDKAKEDGVRYFTKGLHKQ